MLSLVVNLLPVQRLDRRQMSMSGPLCLFIQVPRRPLGHSHTIPAALRRVKRII